MKTIFNSYILRNVRMSLDTPVLDRDDELEYFVINDELENLQEMTRLKGRRLRPYLLNSAAMFDSIRCFDFIVEKLGLIQPKRLMNTAIHTNSTKVLERILRPEFLDSSMVDSAVTHGHLESLKILLEAGCPYDQMSYYTAYGRGPEFVDEFRKRGLVPDNPKVESMMCALVDGLVNELELKNDRNTKR